MIDIIPFDDQHLLDEYVPISIHVGDAKRGLLAAYECHPDCSWSLLKDGKFMGAAGGFPVNEHAMSVWGYFSTAIYDYPIQFSRAMHDLVEFTFEEYSVVRLQLTVAQNFKEGIRFAEWLGFKKEGVMKYAYLDKINAHHILYARYKIK